MFKKLFFIAALLSASIGIARADTFKTVTLSTSGALQAGTTGYSMQIASGTIRIFGSTQATITGLTVTTSTMTRLNVTTAADLGSVRTTNVGTATTANDVPKYHQVGYLQNTQQYTMSADSSTASTTFVPSALTGAITPSSTSSRIKITITSEVAVPVSEQCHSSIYRGTSNLGGTNGFSGGTVVSNTGGTSVDAITMVYIDSPATTSSTTYTMYIESNGGGTVTYHGTNRPSVMILEELNGL